MTLKLIVPSRAEDVLEREIKYYNRRSKMSAFVWKVSSSSLTPFSALFYLAQGFCQAPAAVNCNEGSPEELCCIPEASQLAVVETLYQGTDEGKGSVAELQYSSKSLRVNGLRTVNSI